MVTQYLYSQNSEAETEAGELQWVWAHSMLHRETLSQKQKQSTILKSLFVETASFENSVT